MITKAQFLDIVQMAFDPPPPPLLNNVKKLRFWLERDSRMVVGVWFMEVFKRSHNIICDKIHVLPV